MQAPPVSRRAFSFPHRGTRFGIAMLKRLDRLDVLTLDLDDAIATYRRNFGFEVRLSSEGQGATVTIGGAEIRLKSGPSVASAIAEQGEGMAALWLEAEDVDEVVAALKRAGLSCGGIVRENSRRVLQIDPSVSSRVPLFIFDRK
jgi:glyoxalase/bleomycin resistance protein/dioxygenase superfamily protein